MGTKEDVWSQKTELEQAATGCRRSREDELAPFCSAWKSFASTASLSWMALSAVLMVGLPLALTADQSVGFFAQECR